MHSLFGKHEKTIENDKQLLLCAMKYILVAESSIAIKETSFSACKRETVCMEMFFLIFSDFFNLRH